MTPSAPGTSRAIPPTLVVVRDLANTVDVEGGTDALVLANGHPANPAHARRWLVEHHLWDETGPELTSRDFERLIAFRDTMRAVLKANHDDGAPTPEVVAAWQALTAGATLTVRLTDSGCYELRPQYGGISGVLAAVTAAVYDASVTGAWDRLKICAADACQWAFYDTSKNRSGTWCSMAVCGNRAKVRKYQERKRAAGPDRA